MIKKNEIRSEDVKVKTREDTVALSNRLDVFEDRQQSTVITIKWNILLAQRLIPPLPHQKRLGQKRRIYLFKRDYYTIIIPSFETTFILLSLFRLFSFQKEKKGKITSTKGRERNLVFGFLFFFTFIAARASYFTCFLFIYELPSVVLHFPSSLSIFLSTSKYHFPPPPTSLCSRKRVDVSRSHPSLSLSLSLYSKWSCSASTWGEGELPFRTSIPPVYATSPSIILLSRKNSTNEPNLSDQKRNAQILSLVSQLPPTFFPSFPFLPLFIQFIPPLTLPFIVARYHLPMFYLPAQFIPIYRHFVSRPTRERPFLKVG